MGLAGRGAKPKKKPLRKPSAKPWDKPGLSRAAGVIAFIESLHVTAGALAGQPFTLRPWQRKSIERWYGTDAKGKRIVKTGLLSLGRKNGKTSICAALALCHLAGPEQERRGQIVVAATDPDQSGLIFDELQAFIDDNEQFADECNIK